MCAQSAAERARGTITGSATGSAHAPSAAASEKSARSFCSQLIRTRVITLCRFCLRDARRTQNHPCYGDFSPKGRGARPDLRITHARRGAAPYGDAFQPLARARTKLSNDELRWYKRFEARILHNFSRRAQNRCLITANHSWLSLALIPPFLDRFSDAHDVTWGPPCPPRVAHPAARGRRTSRKPKRGPSARAHGAQPSLRRISGAQRDERYTHTLLTAAC
jgi:hypothetical protein